jgi:hypothetical protein
MTRAALAAVSALIFPIILMASEKKPEPLSSFVDDKGNISLPRDYRTGWVHLGSWVVPAETDPVSGFHSVYTQPESFKAYRESGRFPDGTVIVKEIRMVVWERMPTGRVLHAGEKTRWFVMVKDGKDRFRDNPNWGDGWGWAAFRADNPRLNLSSDYKKDCIHCHGPAKDTDWVFMQGYPGLR